MGFLVAYMSVVSACLDMAHEHADRRFKPRGRESVPDKIPLHMLRQF